jgi:hypothetical protein
LAWPGLQERIGAEFGFTHLRNLHHEEGEINEDSSSPTLLIHNGVDIPNYVAFHTLLKADSSSLADTILYAWEEGGAKERVLDSEFGCNAPHALIDQISGFLLFNAHQQSMAAALTFPNTSQRPSQRIASLLHLFFCLAQWSISFSIPSFVRYSQLRRQLHAHRKCYRSNPSWYSTAQWEESKLPTKVREKLALEWMAAQCGAERGDAFFLWRDGDPNFWSCSPATVLVRQLLASP